MDLLFVPLAHENGGRMGEAARKFLDRLVLRVGGTASERARFRCYAEQRLACLSPNPMDLRVQRRHKKREGKVERDTARVFYMRLSPVRLKIQFNSFQFSPI